MLPILLTLACTGADPEGLTLHADPQSGPLPLTVTFSATGAGADVAVWDFGDGATATGANVEHTFLGSGGFLVTVREQASDDIAGQGPIEVLPGVCPGDGVDEVMGQVDSLAIDEASGLVASQLNPGVLWTHNDSGDTPRFFALDETGALLAIVNLLDVYKGDWEDMALARNPDTDAWQLVAGNVGDNSHDRDDVHIHFIDEPAITPGQDFEELDIAALTIHVTYPDGEMLDCESIMVDPITQDLYLVTKDYDGPAGVYRKSPPHEHESTTELELVKQLDFSVEPLSGRATTGADWSVTGDRAVIRTYGLWVYMWRRDQSEPVDAMWDGEPCELRMPAEQQSESIAFTADNSGLWSLSEGEFQPLNQLRFTD